MITIRTPVIVSSLTIIDTFINILYNTNIRALIQEINLKLVFYYNIWNICRLTGIVAFYVYFSAKTCEWKNTGKVEWRKVLLYTYVLLKPLHSL